MKPFMLTTAIATILVSACTSPRSPRSGDYDDVYYSSSDAPSNTGGNTQASDYTPANQDANNGNQ
ncbi:MAG: hypothetical protein ACKOGP_03990, partial [Bacteroidota bacterium]